MSIITHSVVSPLVGSGGSSGSGGCTQAQPDLVYVIEDVSVTPDYTIIDYEEATS